MRKFVKVKILNINLLYNRSVCKILDKYIKNRLLEKKSKKEKPVLKLIT